MSDFFIPTGDYLRQFIGNSMIKGGDIRDILKKRGTFSSSNDKKVLGPLLVKTGISPEEFESLKESIQTKEENPKVQTRKLTWASEETLVDAIPHDFDFSGLIEDPFGISTVDNDPCFSLAGDGKDPNHLVADIIIKRTDKTKNFGDDTSYHNCSIELKLDDDNNIDLNITVKHSSKESLSVINKVSSRVHNHLKTNGYVSKEPMKKILFGDFTNENRVDFLIELAKSREMYLYYQDIKKIYFAPDEHVKGVKPQEIEWFEKKVKDLMFKGEKLDSSIFLIKPELKKHLKLYSISSSHELNDSDHQGTCVLNLYFQGMEANSELMMEVDGLKIQQKLASENKSNIKLQVLKFLETKKLELYDKYSHKAQPNA
ncbi:hypothetical protein RB979_001389 [Vibrio alginolyticus]|uniref:GapS4b family protein n=1 Tax=Vibrio TaxID=662 RepID=UPI001BD57134|nr:MULTISPECIES: hypothetical protein [Vibrio]ELA6645885.1 hypothetical protein [Vibrio alginolyticus]ELA6779170.1 hypothetical protein [Vibrio alginolyticus]MBS9910076.1 hypothetical protein [Vibrio alginolyticus]MBT0047673.1 hypothetical protein [Vibrio alginolyticus]MBT0061615.1 hypothetical protein [Vibrio alginolyticus]